MTMPADAIMHDFSAQLHAAVARPTWDRSADPDISPADMVILCGHCASDLAPAYRDLLIAAFDGFHGRLISGGTLAGVAKLAGDVQAHYGDAIHTIASRPHHLPDGVQADDRYRTIWPTIGATDFSTADVLNYWRELNKINVRPANVRLIAIGGGTIAAFEIRLALALGVSTAFIAGPGTKAAAMAAAPQWVTCPWLTTYADPLSPETAAGLQKMLRSPSAL